MTRHAVPETPHHPTDPVTLVPQSVSPVQLFAPTRVDASLVPEKRLMLAVTPRAAGRRRGA